MDRPLNGLGGSDIPIVLLGKQYDWDRVDLYNEKKGFVTRDVKGGDIDRGNKMEADTLKESAKILGARAFESLDDSKLIWSKDGLRYGHFDGFVYFTNSRRDTMECKAPRVGKAYAIEAGDYSSLKGWYLQLQSYLEISRDPRGHLCVWNCDKWAPHVISFDADEEIHKKIRVYSKIFMNCLENNVLPTDDLFPNVDYKFPESGIKIQEATQEQASVMSRIKGAKESIKLFDDILDDCKVELVKTWPNGVKKLTFDFGSATIKMGKLKPSITVRFKKEVE